MSMLGYLFGMSASSSATAGGKDPNAPGPIERHHEVASFHRYLGKQLDILAKFPTTSHDAEWLVFEVICKDGSVQTVHIRCSSIPCVTKIEIGDRAYLKFGVADSASFMTPIVGSEQVDELLKKLNACV